MKTIITSSDRSFIDLAELKRYGGLFRYLSLRDVLVRYKQTWIGLGWSVIRPLINILIFGSLSYLVDRSGNFSERFLMVSGGVVFWQLISTSISEVSNSLSNNANILSKVYFPKILLPLSSLLVCLIDFLIAFVIYLVVFIIIKGLPSWQLLLLPLVVFYGLVFSFAFGLLSATASVKYRDVRFLLPFIVQIFFYASPVFLSSVFILNLGLPDWLKVLYQVNPLVFIVNAFKFCFYGVFESYDPFYMGLSFVITLAMLLFSGRYFLVYEKTFTDYL